jgi:hypothetical protein
MMQHRYRTAALLGRWHSTREEACRDALRAGIARIDESGSKKLNWVVPGEIETRRDENQTRQSSMALSK